MSTQIEDSKRDSHLKGGCLFVYYVGEATSSPCGMLHPSKII